LDASQTRSRLQPLEVEKQHSTRDKTKQSVEENAMGGSRGAEVRAAQLAGRKKAGSNPAKAKPAGVKSKSSGLPPAQADTPTLSGESLLDLLTRLLPGYPRFQNERTREAARANLAPCESDPEFRTAVEWVLTAPGNWWGDTARSKSEPDWFLAKNQEKVILAYLSRRPDIPAIKTERRIPYGNPMSLEQLEAKANA
jgi:hypothetical protein